MNIYIKSQCFKYYCYYLFIYFSFLHYGFHGNQYQSEVSHPWILTGSELITRCAFVSIQVLTYFINQICANVIRLHHFAQIYLSKYVEF